MQTAYALSVALAVLTLFTAGAIGKQASVPSLVREQVVLSLTRLDDLE